MLEPEQEPLLLGPGAPAPQDPPLLPVASSGQGWQPTPEEVLRAELEGLGVGKLRQRAVACGLQDDTVDAALDSENPKAAVISLITRQQRDGSAVAAVAAAGEAGVAVRRSGKLGKQGSGKNWRHPVKKVTRRYFDLDEEFLSYYQNTASSSYVPSETIPLDSISAVAAVSGAQNRENSEQRENMALPSLDALAVSPVGGGDDGSGGGKVHAGAGNRPHSLTVVTPKRTYVLIADNDEDRNAWVLALQTNIALRRGRGGQSSTGAAAAAAAAAATGTTAG